MAYVDAVECLFLVTISVGQPKDISFNLINLNSCDIGI